MQQELISRKNVRATSLRAAVLAWSSIVCGALSGLVMGLWSFDGPIPTPAWIGDYDSLPRRFLRLAHVAMFALGVLHMLVARQIAAAPIRPDIDRIALSAMALGNITMPTVLVGAALWEPLKFLSPVPALAVTTAVTVAAISAVRQTQGVWK